jgi:hypothetical protein
MRRGCNDCTVGPVPHTDEGLGEEVHFLLLLHSGSTAPTMLRWTLFGALRQSRRFLIPAALL